MPVAGAAGTTLPPADLHTWAARPGAGGDLLCKGDRAERGRILQLFAAGGEHLAPVLFQRRGREGRKEKVNAGCPLPLPSHFISGSAYMRGLAY